MSVPNTDDLIIPRLRFPEFHDEWQILELNELADKISDGIHTTPKYSKDGEYYFVNGNNFINDQVIIVASTKRVTRLEFDKYRKELSSKTILMSINGTIGNLAQYKSEKIILGKSACYINIKNSANTDFVYNLLKTRKVINYFESEITGSTIMNLSIKTIKNTPVPYPSIQEQEKIAKFLTAVDEKINVLGKKVDLLKQYKKGVMQAIFTQKLRFKDENGNSYPEWEKKAVHDIAYSETSPLAANNITERSGNYKVYGASGVLQTLDTYHYEDEYIAIVKDGAGAGRIIYCDPKSSVLGTLIVVQPKDGICKRFLFYTLSLIDFKKYIVGSTIPHVYFKQYSQTKFKVPLYQEQLKIADFLMTLENKIDSEECRLEQTKRFKKYLLREMFV